MKPTVKERTKVIGDTRITSLVSTTKATWKRISTYWRLPCGCVNPDIWTSDDLHQSECTDCGRRWKHMTTTCEMLDGQPQGPEVYVLTEKMIFNGD